MDTDAQLTVRLARVMAPVTVLGPSARIGLWVQGCALACIGCASRDTWDPAGGHAVAVDDLIASLVASIRELDLGGITLTGGEPTDQGGALTAVLNGVRAELPGLDVLLFTGRNHRAARALAPALVDAATAVVAGPYRRDEPLPGHRLLASANQTLHVASPAKARYATWLAEADPPRMQAMLTADTLFLVGLPEPGDLDRFRATLEHRGVQLEGVSW